MRVVRQPRAPVGGNLLGLLGDGVDVALERQRHARPPSSPSITARACAPEPRMRLPDGDGLAGLLLPMLDEGGIECAIELARRIVGDVQQFGLRARGSRHDNSCRAGRRSQRREF